MNVDTLKFLFCCILFIISVFVWLNIYSYGREPRTREKKMIVSNTPDLNDYQIIIESGFDKDQPNRVDSIPANVLYNIIHHQLIDFKVHIPADGEREYWQSIYIIKKPLDKNDSL